MHEKQNTNVFFDKKIKARVLAISHSALSNRTLHKVEQGQEKPERKVKFERNRGERQQQFERNFGSPLSGSVCTGELSNPVITLSLSAIP